MEMQVDADELPMVENLDPFFADAGVERQERERFSISNLRGRELPLAALLLLVVYNLVVF